MMNLLRDRSRNIQFEAFHVFKVGCMNREKESMLCIHSCRIGVCCQSQQEQAHPGHSSQEPRKVGRVPEQFPQ